MGTGNDHRPHRRYASGLAKAEESIVAETMATRRDMEAEPYSPVPMKPEFRNSRSFEYIAFYLGEIAKELQTLNTNAASLDKTLQAISSKMTRPD
jgi:hypothetical protein